MSMAKVCPLSRQRPFVSFAASWMRSITQIRAFSCSRFTFKYSSSFFPTSWFVVLISLLNDSARFVSSPCCLRICPVLAKGSTVAYRPKRGAGDCAREEALDDLLSLPPSSASFARSSLRLRSSSSFRRGLSFTLASTTVLWTWLIKRDLTFFLRAFRCSPYFLRYPCWYFMMAVAWRIWAILNLPCRSIRPLGRVASYCSWEVLDRRDSSATLPICGNWALSLQRC